jgi:heparinase II/III-like protein
VPLDLPAETFSRLEEKTEGWWSALRSRVLRLAFRKFPGLTIAALEMEAQGFRANSLPRIFSSDLREIPPALNEDLLDLYGRSEQILANRFSFFHAQKEFPRGIDWAADKGSAWSRELHSFDFALDLALTYRISREERYARHLRYLIADWVAANPPTRGAGWESEALARRLRNWVLASDLAREDWEADSEFLRLVAKSLALQAASLDEAFNPSASLRASLRPARALAFLQVFFPQSEWQRFSFRPAEAVARRLDEEREFTGPFLEPLDYLEAAETLLDIVLLNLRATGFDSESVKDILRRVLEPLETLLLPDGTLPLFGPEATTGAASLQNLHAAAAVLFDEPRWKALAGQWGILPHLFLGEEGWRRFQQLPLRAWISGSSSKAQSGIYRLVGAESSALIANLRPPTSAGGHQDYLSFELMLGGQRVVVDSGAFRPPGDSPDDSSARPEAHNCLLIEMPHGKLPAGKLRIPSSLRELFGDGWEGFSAPGTLAGHERGWFVIEQNIWVVLDRLSGEQAGRVTHLLHFFPTFALRAQGGRILARSRALVVTVLPLGPSPGATLITRGDDARFPGWYAPEFGTRFLSSVLALEWQAAPSHWLGGVALVVGEPEEFRSGETDAAAGTAEFWLSGKRYKLSFREGTSSSA